MKCVLFSRPNHDVPMAYLNYYSKELVGLVAGYGLKAVDKEGKDANKRIISKVIDRQNPCLIMFNGHGTPEEIWGQDDEVLISTKNSEILAKTITYALACSSASVLGKLACEKGANAFVGYEDEFALGRDSDSEATPGRDRIAKLFLEPSNLLFSSLMKGNTVKEAIKKAKRKMIENVSFLSTTDEFPEAIYYAPYLFGNLLCLAFHGDGEASIG